MKESLTTVQVVSEGHRTWWCCIPSEYPGTSPLSASALYQRREAVIREDKWLTEKRREEELAMRVNAVGDKRRRVASGLYKRREAVIREEKRAWEWLHLWPGHTGHAQLLHSQGTNTANTRLWGFCKYDKWRQSAHDQCRPNCWHTSPFRCNTTHNTQHTKIPD